jgi:membrane protein YqaA with SNARE-associated domain
MIDIAALAAVVLLFNLMPAFAPPTWAVLVLFSLNTDLHPIVIVAVGAVFAGTGRYLLARATGLFRNRISKKSLANLEAAQTLLTKNTSRKLFTIGMFVLSPLPSAQLFEAAGLMGVRLLPLTVAFFSGRIVTYNFYVFGASELKAHGIGELITKEFTSIWAVLFQLVMIASVILLTRIDWKRFLPTKPSSS